MNAFNIIQICLCVAVLCVVRRGIHHTAPIILTHIVVESPVAAHRVIEVRQVRRCQVEAGRRVGAGIVSHGAEEAGVVPGREEEEVHAEDRQAADSLGAGLRHYGAHQPGQDAAGRDPRPRHRQADRPHPGHGGSEPRAQPARCPHHATLPALALSTRRPRRTEALVAELAW